MALAQTTKWDRHLIKAEVERQGYSLQEIARRAGAHERICSHGLAGNSSKGARLIASAIGVPFDELFQDYPSYQRVIARERRAASANGKPNDRCIKGKSRALHGQEAGAR